jgi:hypothetical protein
VGSGNLDWRILEEWVSYWPLSLISRNSTGRERNHAQVTKILLAFGEAENWPLIIGAEMVFGLGSRPRSIVKRPIFVGLDWLQTIETSICADR